MAAAVPWAMAFFKSAAVKAAATTAAGAVAGAAATKAIAGNQEAPQIDVPKPPTTDDALKSEQDISRIRRRRGVLSNIFAGAGGAAPSVGIKSLLGQ